MAATTPDWKEMFGRFIVLLVGAQAVYTIGKWVFSKIVTLAAVAIGCITYKVLTWYFSQQFAVAVGLLAGKSFYSKFAIRYSNPENNHDDKKFRHKSRDSAQREIQRMQASGHYEGTDRLVAYYNPGLGAWFVGRSKYNDGFSWWLLLVVVLLLGWYESSTTQD